jgi:hypothetical protein
MEVKAVSPPCGSIPAIVTLSWAWVKRLDVLDERIARSRNQIETEDEDGRKRRKRGPKSSALFLFLLHLPSCS